MAATLSGSQALSDFTPGIPTKLADPGSGDASFQWALAWVMFIAILAVIAQSDTGYRIVYYVLLLIILLLVVTQYQGIAGILLPIGTPIPTGPAQTS